MASSNSLKSLPLPSSVSSASTSRLRKRGQTLSPSNRSSGGGYSLASRPSGKLLDEADGTDLPALKVLKRASSPGSFALEVKGPGTPKSTWLRRMSTLSSLKSGSHDSTPLPGSPSLSYSNGSTALILPNTIDQGLAGPPPNKLVKRTSSQKFQYGNSISHSTLRRPATSHQRTLQQRYSAGDELKYRTKFAPSIPFDDLEEDRHSDDDSLQNWLPYFTPQGVSTRDGYARKRFSGGGTYRRDSVGCTLPSAKGPPTLLLATSISVSSLKDMTEDIMDNHQPAALRRPSTALGLETFIPPSTPDHETQSNSKQDPGPKTSFSIAGIFPSPSPSTWKIPRSGSIRRSKFSNGRVSPPANAKHSSTSISDEEPPDLNPPRRRNSGHFQGSVSGTALSTVQDSPSSLPPLKRLSSLDIDLSATAPPYPTSANSIVPSSPKLSSASSPLLSSPSAIAVVRNKSHRPSGAPSDRTSTLLGSDNENSRFLSSDEDEFDCRSETVYDSTRTGATGSSHSGVRRRPIQTVFDESPTMDPPKHKVLALQDLLSNESFVQSDALQCNAEAEQGLVTPIRAKTCAEELYPTLVHDANRLFPTDISPSPQEISSKATQDGQINQDFDDEDWSFENVADTNQIFPRHNSATETDQSKPLGTSPRFSLRLPHTPSPRVEASQKMNIFEWSEQPSVEKESSGRPKTVHGMKAKDIRSSRLGVRRGPNALHLRSQSVPAPQDGSGHRPHNHAAKLESWVLGNKGVSEDWDGDFDFEETQRSVWQTTTGSEAIQSSNLSGMLVPRAILERQASVHGQFGQVKELTLLVEELKRLRQQATVQGIIQGQSAELWKEAEGIINLATLDDEEQEFPPPRSPLATGSEFDVFDEDSPSSFAKRKSGYQHREDRLSNGDDTPSSQKSSRSSPDKSALDTPTKARPRKESAAKAKSVLETIHQQRVEYNSPFSDARSSQKKLPFDTTSLRDLVTRAGVVTRALKEIVRRAENGTLSPATKPQPTVPPDPLFSQIFQQHSPSSPVSKTPRLTQSPKSNNFRGGPIANTDNDINGHMKMMTVV